MKKYFDSSRVRPGVYWNLRTWKIQSTANTGCLFSEDQQISCLRVPLLLVVLGASLSSIVYVITVPILFPITALGITLNFLARKTCSLEYKPGFTLHAESENHKLDIGIDPRLGFVCPDGGLPVEHEDENEL